MFTSFHFSHPVHFVMSTWFHAFKVQCSCWLCYCLSHPGAHAHIEHTCVAFSIWTEIVCVCFCLSFCRNGYSLASGVFPICSKCQSSLFGCSTDLLNLCMQGPRAKTPPTTVRRRVFTYPSLSHGKAQLINKGDQIETHMRPHPPTHTHTHTHLNAQTPSHTPAWLICNTFQFKSLCMLISHGIAGGLMVWSKLTQSQTQIRLRCTSKWVWKVMYTKCIWMKCMLERLSYSQQATSI